MDASARWAGYLAMAAGALTAILAAFVAYDPNTAAWNGFFLVVVLLAAAVFGLERPTRAVTGQMGRASAWLSIGGAVGLLAVFAYGLLTDQVTSASLNPLWAVTAGAWFLGSIGFGVAIIRSKALSVLGGWLVLAGAVIGAGTSVIPSDSPAQVVLPLGLLLFGIGWILVGYAATRPSARRAT